MSTEMERDKLKKIIIKMRNLGKMIKEIMNIDH